MTGHERSETRPGWPLLISVIGMIVAIAGWKLFEVDGARGQAAVLLGAGMLLAATAFCIFLHWLYETFPVIHGILMYGPIVVMLCLVWWAEPFVPALEVVNVWWYAGALGWAFLGGGTR